jgi:hypothetical protein
MLVNVDVKVVSGGYNRPQEAQSGEIGPNLSQFATTVATAGGRARFVRKGNFPSL